MSKNFLKTEHTQLKTRHYILKTSLPNFFFNFRPSVMEKYKTSYGEDFMLICWRDSEKLDAYFFPYSEVKHVFTEENLTIQNNTSCPRWLGTINNQTLSLGGLARLDVTRYYNTGL